MILLGHRYLTKKLTTNGLFLLKFFYFLFIVINNAKLRHWNLRWKITRFTAAFLGRCFLRLPLRNQTDSLLDMVTMVGIELPIWSGLGRNFNVSNCRLVQTVCLMLSATTKTDECFTVRRGAFLPGCVQFASKRVTSHKDRLYIVCMSRCLSRELLSVVDELEKCWPTRIFLGILVKMDVFMLDCIYILLLPLFFYSLTIMKPLF